MSQSVDKIIQTIQPAAALEPPRHPEKMSGARKAAILCLSLGEEAAAELFKHLDEEEVQALSKELALLPNVKSEISESVVSEFNNLLMARNYVTTGGVDYAKRLLVKSFGVESAKRMTEKVIHSLEAPASFENLQKTDPQQLAKLFQSEHPQTIAVVMAHLDASTASTVLQQLPEAQRGDIILRLASLQTVSQDVVKRIAHILNQKLSSVKTVSRTSVGGIRTVADICNRLDKESMRLMLEQIEGSNPELSLEIRNLMVTFEDLLLIDDIGIREIMQRVDKKVLSLALKGTLPELQERFYSNMSSRAVEMMKEEMEFMGQVKMKEVTAAQREVIEVLRELDEQGIVSLTAERPKKMNMLAKVFKNQTADAFTPFAIAEIGAAKPQAEGVGAFVFPSLETLESPQFVSSGESYSTAPTIENVLQNAREEAEEIIAQAKSQSQIIEQNAREQAMQEARRALEAENSTQITELRQQLTETITQISALSEEITNRIEKDVVELALEIAKKIVAREVTIDREIAFALVKVSLAKLHNRSIAQVHLNPEDFAFVESHREKLGFRGSLELIEDRSISMGGCLIHTETGEIDARIKSQFEEITHGLLGD